MTDAGIAAGLALGAAAGTTLLLAFVALRTGWVDRLDPQVADRKPRTEPVPLVGGTALLVGLACWDVASGDRALPWGALLVAWAVGSLDDVVRGGLRPARKLLGQCLAGIVLAAWWPDGGAGARAAVVVAAIVAQNAMNTFDNADGAATSVALLGLAPYPGVRAVLLGFLPFNLVRRPGSAVPFAYLGDAGSHVLGVLLVCHAGAPLALLLPLLDLARLVGLRLARGQKPWVGDRSHLAHRLAARGLPPLRVVLVLVAIACPPLIARVWSAGSSPWVALGAIATTLLFGACVRWTADPH